MRRLRALIVCLPLPLFSQAPEPVSLPQPPTDYSTAFHLLTNLGMPDVGGAKWGRFEPEGGGWFGWNPLKKQTESLHVKLRGNAWRLSGDPDEQARIVPAGGLTVVKASIRPERGALGRLLARSDVTEPNGRIAGSFLEASIEKDLAALSTALALDDDALTDPAEENIFASVGQRVETAGAMAVLLTFAAQAHAAGVEAEAKVLASQVLTRTANPELVVDQAVSRIAEHHLDGVTDKFFRNFDWTEYEKELRDLLGSFPRGWDRRGAVQLLLAGVEARAADAPVPAPEIRGETLAPEALARLVEMLEDAPEQTLEKFAEWARRMGWDLRSMSEGERRQLREQLRPSGDLFRSAVAIDWHSRAWPLTGIPGDFRLDGALVDLCRLRLDGVLGLAAVVTDGTLIPHERAGDPDAHSYQIRHRSFQGASEWGAERTAQYYLEMRRPLSRGELARMVLESALPDRNGALVSLTADQLQNFALDWWRKAKSRSEVELAWQYFHEGVPLQQAAAAEWMAAQRDDELASALESALLETDRLPEELFVVEAYVKIRKEKARDFFAELETRLRRELDGVDLGGDFADPFGDDVNLDLNAIRWAGGLDGYLKKLKVHVDPPKPDAVLADLLAESLDARTALDMLADVFEGRTRDHALFLVRAARTVKKVEDRAWILYDLAFGGEPGVDDSAWLMEGTRDHWEALLADEREPPEDWPLELSRFGDIAAVALEVRSGFGYERVFGLQQKLRQPVSSNLEQLFSARARARLAGEEVPPIPDASRVPEARREEFRKGGADGDPLEIREMVEAMSLDEELAWNELLTEWDSDLPAGIRQLLVTVVDVEDGLPSAFRQWEPGVVVTRKLIEETVVEIRRDFDRVAGTIVVLAPAPGLAGLTFASDPGGHVRYPAHRTTNRLGKYGALDGIVSLWVGLDGDWRELFWFSTEEDPSFDEEQVKLFEAIDRALEARDQPLNLVFVAHSRASAGLEGKDGGAGDVEK